jgi:hypothetical protein
MKSEEESEELLVYSLLPLCSRQLGLPGLACLATCSKQCKLMCDELRRTDATDVLLGTLEAAIAEAQAAAGAIDSRKQANIAAWWQPVKEHMQAMPAPFKVVGVASRLLWLPSVPLKQATQWVKAGVRIRYAQLRAAASCMVSGLEVWVKAQQQLGIRSDIPMAAVDVCYGGVWVSCRHEHNIVFLTSISRGAALPHLRCHCCC